MTKIENDCVDCGQHCVGSSCPYVNVPHHYCDRCGEEAPLYDYDGEELCGECVLKNFEVLYE